MIVIKQNENLLLYVKQCGHAQSSYYRVYDVFPVLCYLCRKDQREASTAKLHLQSVEF